MFPCVFRDTEAKSAEPLDSPPAGHERGPLLLPPRLARSLRRRKEINRKSCVTSPPEGDKLEVVRHFAAGRRETGSRASRRPVV